MTDREKNIMADAFYWLRDHSDPPTGDAAPAWWDEAATAMQTLDAKHGRHPLVLRIMPALYSYVAEVSQYQKAGVNR